MLDLYELKQFAAFADLGTLSKVAEEFHLSRRDFLLTIAVSVLSGIVFGMLKSPHKTQIIGCGNGNGTWSPEMEEAIFDEAKESKEK